MMLILGEKYGAIQSSDLSATHEEYNEALENNKSILVFQQNDISPDYRQGMFIEQVRGWACGHFLAFFSDATELKTGMIRALHKLAIEQSDAGVEDTEIVGRATARITELAEFDRLDATLALVVAAGPKRSVLRPSELDNDNFRRKIESEAIYGNYSIFDRSAGVSIRVYGNALIFLNESSGGGRMHYGPATLGSLRSIYQSHQRINTLMIDEEGTIRITRPAYHIDYDHMKNSLPSMIEEEIGGEILKGMMLVSRILDLIDDSQRLTHVAIISALLGDIRHIPLRTRAEQKRSPNTIELGWMLPETPITASLDQGVHPRAVLFGKKAEEIAEDMAALLRRSERKQRFG